MRTGVAKRVDDGTAGIWLAGGGVALCLAAIVGVVVLLATQTMRAFWPEPVVQLQWRDGAGDHDELAVIVHEDRDHLVARISETDRAGQAYVRIAVRDVRRRDVPVDAVAQRRADGGVELVRGREYVSTTASNRSGNRRIVETITPNTLGMFGKWRILAARLVEFVSDGPSGSNAAGGLWPALVGTVVLVLTMSVLVMPLGVLVAVWLHEYARAGWHVRLIRAAIANLAGVPAVIYGLFGLTLFVHGMGGIIDAGWFGTRAPAPTFATGGLLWASLTLALLTLPVVIIATEEGLARVPASLRHGALALGATRAETTWRLLLPAARPAMLTALILAIARAAGEVAPLMLVGVVKLAPALPLDGEFPYLHPSRQFMHLGYAIYDEALAGTDVWRTTPRAYATALLLVLIVVALNLCAIVLRNRLRERGRQWSE